MDSQDTTFVSTTPSTYILALWGLAVLLLGLVLHESLAEMGHIWIIKEEYSHGFFIPIISVYLIWVQRDQLKFVRDFNSSLLGIAILVFGLLLFLLGGLATIRTIQHYAFIVAFVGIFAAAFGKEGLKTAWVPLAFLVFMVPFPEFIINNLSSKLQLMSSWLGVEFIRACDIMVYLEGNVIDLGGYKLQVVEACSGLRYLFPLASLSFLCAYLFKGPVWQKILIFLSSVPLTIFMNSFRIGVIGLLVNSWGTEMAEGFLHDFEGWAVFLLCMVLLFIEMWVFSRFSGKKIAFSELVQLPDEWFSAGKTSQMELYLNKSVFVVLALILTVGVSGQFVRGGEEVIPQRKGFNNFPLQLDTWQGHREYIEQKYLDTLKLTDYIVANYVAEDAASSVNFYSAYYESQRKGVSVHSPRSCIPGDGWQITNFGQREFPDLLIQGTPLTVNRAVIEKGEYKQLVYYWFQQRGRSITNEYLVKWYLFYDAITLHRTDGALVRLVTTLDKGQDIDVADQRLQAFMRTMVNVLPDYLPGKQAIPADVIQAD
ncbi:VPLPA-CTERM-specific exosortase XrtD [Methylomonas methanica]|uniref:EpsI family protein n=1 Tax=Methylomonas methanica (strain DSM 25384 / MC09) TaxID=857087 RepID=G0A1H0_METMM|nr:VPLPA-CTERM-specific exosortase XrtD [Methylomonas methanica]AEF98863.1 EpsI family protein [Methylomonas methanica MC09]